MTSGEITTKPGLIGLSVMRNEMLRLPLFLQYYRRLGVERFVIVDNDSRDGSYEYLRSQADVRVLRTHRSYGSPARGGLQWLHLLWDRWGPGNWCLIADCDELLVYPGVEHRGLPELCAALDREGATALGASLIDIYSDRPLAATHYRAGQDFLSVCPYFDRLPVLPSCMSAMRKRVFGIDCCALKVPLIRYSRDIRIAPGCHHVLGAARCSAMSGAVLHFKYLNDFAERAQIEAIREEHYQQACEYKEYARVLRERPDLNLFSEADSIRYRGSCQLVELGLMQDPASAQAAALAESI